jgi:hypothetical protein
MAYIAAIAASGNEAAEAKVPMAETPCQTCSVRSRIFNYEMNLAADLLQVQPSVTSRTTDDCNGAWPIRVLAVTPRLAVVRENPRARG